MQRFPRIVCAVVLSAATGAMGRTAMPQEKGPSAPRAETPAASDEPTLSMTPAVACLSITAVDDYEPLPGAALSSDEKLLVYYSPTNYRVTHDGEKYRFHLIQDGQIRPKGKKTVLLSKLKMIDEDWKGARPPGRFFMRSLVALKGLKPGEYEFDIILHDALAPGSVVARQSIPFRVVPAGPRNDKGEVAP